MQQLPIAAVVIATIAINVMDFWVIGWQEVQSTVGTFASLRFQEVGHAGGACRILASALAPVHPVPVIWAFGIFDQDMPDDGRLSMAFQDIAVVVDELDTAMEALPLSIDYGLVPPCVAAD
jgi:hypothetical protein